MNVNESLPNLSGIEQFRMLIAQGGTIPIGETFGFRLHSIEEGRAVFKGTPGPGALNPIGSVHGGYAATLLDSACGCAVHSKLSATQAYTSLELKVSFIRGMTLDTGEVTATGTLLSIGRRVAFAEASLTDRNGKLLASATSTLLVFER